MAANSRRTNPKLPVFLGFNFGSYSLEPERAELTSNPY